MNMLQNLQTMLKKACALLAQVVAGIVIVLALIVGIARLLLPEAAAFKEDIRAGVTAATGFALDFEMIGAGLSVYGPELRLSAVTLDWPDGSSIAQVKGLAVSLDVWAWVSSGQWVPSRILLEGTVVNVTIDPEGEWLLQGRPWKDFVSGDTKTNLEEFPESRLQLEDVAFSFTDQSSERPPVNAVVKHFDATLRDMQVEVVAELLPGAELGRSLELEAELPVRLILADEEVDAARSWQLSLFADDLNLDRWLAVAQIKDLPVINTKGDITVHAGLIGLQVIEFSSELDLEELELMPLQATSDPVVIHSLTAQLDWLRSDNGWVASGKGVRIDRDSRSWLESKFHIDFQETEEGRQQIFASSSFLRLEDLLPFLQAVVPKQLDEAGFAATVAGDVTDLTVSLLLDEGKVNEFAVDAAFTGLTYATDDGELLVVGLNGNLAADNAGGNLMLATTDAQLGYRPIFSDVLEISSLQGLAIWRAGEDGHRILADGIQLLTPHASGRASLELSFDNDFQNPFIDLTAAASMNDINNVHQYMPLIIPPKVLEWLGTSLQGGSVPAADFKFRGPLNDFPYEHGEGDFLIQVNFVDAELDYAPDWPGISDAAGLLVFDGVSMYSTSNSLQIANTTIENISLRMNDMRDGEIELSGASQVELNNVTEFLQNSPIGTALGPIFNDVHASGQGDATMELMLPIKNMDDWQLESVVRVQNGQAGLVSFADSLSDISGEARINNIDVSVEGMTGSFLGRPVSIDVIPVTSPTSAFSHRAMISGNFGLERLRNMVGVPEVEFLSGDIDLTAQALFPGGPGGAEPFHLVVRSDLQGMVSSLPYPLDKDIESTEGVQVQIEFPDRDITHIYGSLDRGLSWAIELQQDAQPWMVTRGAVVRDVKLPLLPEKPGLIISGEVESLSLDEWIGQFADTDEVKTAEPLERRWQQMFRQVNLQIGELEALGYQFIDVDADIGFYIAQWDMQISGPWAEGRVVLPYDFEGPEPVVLDMERLLLIEPLTAEGENDAPLDPRSLPAVQGRISDLAIGSLRLGRADMDVVRVRDGLRSRSFTTQSEFFGTQLSYDWLVIDNAQRSRLHVALSSSDVEDTLVKLGFSPLIEAKRASVIGDLLWEGGPGMDAIYASTGSIDLTIRDGRLIDVDAGSGRLLGLLSVTAIPRRFALDFKDVSDDGLSFEKINGDFRIDFGDAWTCNLGLEGSIADMGIVGRASFLNEDYDQVAAVRPHVSNLAPVAGAFLAGPAIGIATLLVTQILKKPLSSIGESYYTIRGSFDEPEFLKVDRDTLDTTPFADCEQQLPTLSPEEIAAIKDLLEGATEPALEVPVPVDVPPESTINGSN